MTKTHYLISLLPIASCLILIVGFIELLINFTKKIVGILRAWLRTKDLNQLIQAILTEAYASPKKSNFIAQYQLYNPQANAEEVENVLVELLSAAHSAAQLRKNIDFSVVEEPGRLRVSRCNTGFARVLIKNQLKKGQPLVT